MQIETTKKIKVGIVGLGLRGRLMAHLVHDMVDSLELAAVCDTSLEKWETFITAEDPVPISKKYPEE